MSDYPFVKIVSKTEPSFDFLSSKDIKVFYLEAPLSIAKPFNTMFTQLNLYHTGLGFECENIRFELEFTANTPMADAILPKIVNDKLVWTNQTSVRLGELSLDYWVVNTYLCTITRDQFIKFRDDILNNFIPNNLFYVLAKGSKTSATYDLEDPYLKSSTCDDFVVYGINFFKNLGIKIEYVTYPKITNINLIGVIKKLDYDINKNEIFDFYKNLLKYIHNYIDLSDVQINTELIITLISKFYYEFNKIIYYSYDVNDSSKMCYYSFKLTEIPMVSYKKTIISNSYSYLSFNDMLQNTNNIPINPNTNSSSSLNNLSNKTKYILLFTLLLIVFVICILIIYNRKKIFKKNRIDIF